MSAPELERIDAILADSDNGVTGIVALKRSDLANLRKSYHAADLLGMFAVMAYLTLTLGLIALILSGTITIVWN